MNLTTFAISVWNNKHTSSSAVILFLCSAVGIIWPETKEKVNEIANLAVIYGLITAGDAKAVTPPVLPPPKTEEVMK